VKSAEHLVGHEWAEWYRLTPVQRWQESTKLWQTYLALGGTLDPEPDTQSPFFDPKDAHQTSPKQRRIEKTVRLQWSAELESLRLTK
jgi:hypothetical protein